jgi:hypothetical protein
VGAKKLEKNEKESVPLYWQATDVVLPFYYPFIYFPNNTF